MLRGQISRRSRTWAIRYRSETDSDGDGQGFWQGRCSMFWLTAAGNRARSPWVFSEVIWYQRSHTRFFFFYFSQNSYWRKSNRDVTKESNNFRFFFGFLFLCIFLISPKTNPLRPLIVRNSQPIFYRGMTYEFVID